MSSKKDHYPLISILTPSLNKVDFIEQAIKSVILQNYPNIEHIIVDGMSSDGTLDKIKKYKKFGHIKLFVEKDRNYIEALNKALRRAKGEIIVVLNADDFFMEGVFTKVSRFFVENPEETVLVGNCNVVNEQGSIIRTSKPVTSLKKILQPWKYEFPINPSSYFYRNIHSVIGQFDESYGLAADYEFLIRMARRYNFNWIDEEFGNFRYYSDSITYKNQELILTTDIGISKKFHGNWRQGYLYYRFSYLQYLLNLNSKRLIQAAIIYLRMKIKLRTRIDSYFKKWKNIIHSLLK